MEKIADYLLSPDAMVIYQTLQKKLAHEPNSRALAVLQMQLLKYENILKDNSLNIT